MARNYRNRSVEQEERRRARIEKTLDRRKAREEGQEDPDQQDIFSNPKTKFGQRIASIMKNSVPQEDIDSG
tara:strand:- start:3630 stop:3842 length:213 start_codon:yes stop_codon:yes gene_type:complete